MTRARNNAQGQLRREGNHAATRARAQRSLATVRLQVCANVFAGSRIHFDADRWTRALATAMDEAPAWTDVRNECDAQDVETRSDEFTIH